MGDDERIGHRAGLDGVPVPIPHGPRGGRIAFTAVTRRLTAEARVHMDEPTGHREMGQLVLARVLETQRTAYARDRTGRSVRLYEGALIVGAWVDRPDGLSPGLTRLRTSGGLIGEGPGREPCLPRVDVVGHIADLAGTPLTTGAIARMPARPAIPAIGTIAVVGMDGCAEEVAAAVVHGWARTGFAVGAGRVAGDENGTHRWAMADAGAHVVADFVDFGMPSTHPYPAERGAATMLAVRDTLVADGAQVVILQVDDAARTETWPLLGRLASIADGVVVCADDEADARAALGRLEGLAVPVRIMAGAIADQPETAARVSGWSGLPVRANAELHAGAAATLLDDHERPD